MARSLTSIRGEKRPIYSFEIDWANFDWAGVETGGPDDPNMHVIFPLKFKPADQVMRECQQAEWRASYLAAWGKKYRRLK